MRYQSFQFNRHYIMLSIVIISLLTISGCTSTVDDKSGVKVNLKKPTVLNLTYLLKVNQDFYYMLKILRLCKMNYYL